MNIKIELRNLPPWIQEDVQKLNDLVEVVSKIGEVDIRCYTDEQVNALNRKIISIQNLHHQLIDNSIVLYAGQDSGWVTLDKMTIQEVNEKLDIISHRISNGPQITGQMEVIDVSQKKPGDDFDDEGGSFW